MSSATILAVASRLLTAGRKRGFIGGVRLFVAFYGTRSRRCSQGILLRPCPHKQPSAACSSLPMAHLLRWNRLRNRPHHRRCRRSCPDRWNALHRCRDRKWNIGMAIPICRWESCRRHRDPPTTLQSRWANKQCVKPFGGCGHTTVIHFKRVNRGLQIRNVGYRTLSAVRCTSGGMCKRAP